MSIWLNVSVYTYPNTCRMKKEEITSFSHLNFFNCFFFFSTKQVTLLINNMKFIKYKKKEKNFDRRPGDKYTYLVCCNWNNILFDTRYYKFIFPTI